MTPPPRQVAQQRIERHVSNPNVASVTRTLRLKVRAEPYSWLNAAAMEVNQVCKQTATMTTEKVIRSAGGYLHEAAALALGEVMARKPTRAAQANSYIDRSPSFSPM